MKQVKGAWEEFTEGLTRGNMLFNEMTIRRE